MQEYASSLTSTEIVGRAKRKLKNELMNGQISVERASQLVSQMQAVERVDAQRRLPQAQAGIQGAAGYGQTGGPEAGEYTPDWQGPLTPLPGALSPRPAAAQALGQRGLAPAIGDISADGTEQTPAFTGPGGAEPTSAATPAIQNPGLQQAAARQDSYSHTQREGTVIEPRPDFPIEINFGEPEPVRKLRTWGPTDPRVVRQNEQASEAAWERIRAQDLLRENWLSDREAEWDDFSPEDRSLIRRIMENEEKINRLSYVHQEDTAPVDPNERERMLSYIAQLQQTNEEDFKTLADHGIRGKYLEDIFRHLEMMQNKERTKQVMQQSRDFVDDGAANATVASIFAAPERIVGDAIGFVDVLGQKWDRFVSGSKAPVDIYSDAQLLSNQAAAIKEEVSENIYQWGVDSGHEEIGWVLSKAYEMGMDISSNLAAAATGPFAPLIIGLDSANQSYKQAISQGASDNEAFVYSIGVGLLGGFATKYSASDLIKRAGQGDLGLREALTNTFESMGLDGFQAVAVQYADFAMEEIALGNNSQLAQISKEAYEVALQEGKSEEEANQEATWAGIAYLLKRGAISFINAATQKGLVSAAKSNRIKKTIKSEADAAWETLQDMGNIDYWDLTPYWGEYRGDSWSNY